MSDKQARKKRKKQYYRQVAKKGRWAHALDADMRGFLVTCNNRERDAVREAYNILNEYADRLYGPEQSKTKPTEEVEAEDDSDVDIEEAMNKEVAEIQSQGKKENRRFQQVESGATNCIFIKTTLDDPVELVDNIFADIHDTQKSKSRYIMRFLPIVGTCKCNDENVMKKMAETALKAHFTGPLGRTFCINSKIRNNNGVKKNDLTLMLLGVIRDLNPANSPDLDHPEYVVGVDVMRNVMCLSVLRYFTKFRKYNLQEVTTVKESKGAEKDPPEKDAKADDEKREGKEECNDSEETKRVNDEKCEEKEVCDDSEEAKQAKEETTEKVDHQNGKTNESAKETGDFEANMEDGKDTSTQESTAETDKAKEGTVEPTAQ